MAVPNKYGFKNNKDLQDMDLAIEAKFNSLMDKMFPIGSIVITTDNKNPAEKGYPGNKSDWRLICDGRTIIGRSADGPAPFDTTGGNEGANHTHTIYASELQNEYIPSGLAEDRQIYSDVLDGDSEQCDPEHSEGLCYKYLLHSDDDLTGAYQFGKLELRKTYTTYAWNQELWPGRQPQIGYSNPIMAASAGGGEALVDNMPPYMVMNIWRRYT